MAGTARCDITPPPGIPQGGWGAQTHPRGLGSDLPLYATALVLSKGDLSVAIVEVDSIEFDIEWAAEILETVTGLTRLPRGNIRFSCSHTHRGPNTFRLGTVTEGRDLVLGYLELAKAHARVEGVDSIWPNSR